MTKLCPKCGSKETQSEAYMDITILKCKNCGYDESTLYEIYPEQKTSQKAKGQFSPYKTGGGKRTIHELPTSNCMAGNTAKRRSP
ncbi:MAG: hypothetical protein AABX82_08315 [Nanoarchaeota archaeon]